jgi:hypothetical protein
MDGQNATFKIFAEEKVSKPVTLSYSMSGQAIRGKDYTLSGTFGKVTIPAGQSFATVTLHSIDEHERGETKETAIMTLKRGTGYELLNSSATVTILP